MKQVFLFLFCTLYPNGFLQGQSPVFICPDTGEKGVENAAVQKGEKNVSRRSFNNWAEEHPVLPGESLANAIAGSHQALTDAPLSVTDLDSALTVNNTWGTFIFLTERLQMRPILRNFTLNHF